MLAFNDCRTRKNLSSVVSYLQALDRFKKEPNGVLVATDVAARGLDVPDVRCVVRFPWDSKPSTQQQTGHRMLLVKSKR